MWVIGRWCWRDAGWPSLPGPSPLLIGPKVSVHMRVHHLPSSVQKEVQHVFWWMFAGFKIRISDSKYMTCIFFPKEQNTSLCFIAFIVVAKRDLHINYKILPYFLYYRPQMKFAKVMFLHLSVILSTGGVSASLHAGMHTSWQTPPLADIPLGRHQPQPPPLCRHPPGSR